MKCIPLSQGFVAIVDDKDYEIINQWKWSVHKRGKRSIHARRKTGKVNVYMHRVILGLNDPQIKVDHKDRNGLNNRRKNLRIATVSQNGSNILPKSGSTSKYLGVCWDKHAKKWKAEICKNGNSRHLGLFVDEIEAAKAYNSAAKKLHREFANLNKF